MQNRYPKIYIRSKNELAKHLSHKKFTRDEARDLINDVIKNFDQYWRDNKNQSEPSKDKYVRSAKGTKLGVLLEKINTQILAPHDKLLPDFIFGGLSGKNHVMAVGHLLGRKRHRTVLKMDIQRFFEQVSAERVYAFFREKCRCDDRGAKILTDLCCVRKGPKESIKNERTIARGFATSSRLAVWCNLDTFLRLDWLIKKRLKRYDPRIAIYVDDIGITASRVPKDQMEKLSVEAKKLLEYSDGNQPLPVNTDKTKIISHEKGIEHLGIIMFRNRLGLGKQTFSKKNRLKERLRHDLKKEEKEAIKNSYQSMMRYKRYVENFKDTAR